MKTQLFNGDFGTYEIQPVSKRLRARLERETGAESVLFQTDYDFPCLARNLGWSGKIGRERCEHRSTDGTVDCKDCGRTVSEFIGAAVDWLDAHNGQVFRGKGEEYFNL